MGSRNIDKNIKYWAYGIALIVIGLILTIALLIVNSQALTLSPTGSVDISGVGPSIDSKYVSNSAYGGINDYDSGITVAAGGQETIHINGTVSDENGFEDIDSVTVDFFRSGITAAGCDEVLEEDNNDCYRNTSCTTANGSGTTIDYDCPLTLEYWIDATDVGGTYDAEMWMSIASVDDGTGPITNTTSYPEVNTVTAGMGTSIGWGTLALGTATNSGNNDFLTIIQRGNDVIDVEVSMTDTGMACNVQGEIPRGNIQWDLTDDGIGGAGFNVLTGSAVDTNLAVGLRTSEILQKSKNFYWDVSIPASGLSGDCESTVTVNVIAS